MALAIPPGFVFDVVEVSEPSLSPDGSNLVFVRSQWDNRKNGLRSELMIMDVSKLKVVRLTGEDRDSKPKYAPNGEAVAFLRPCHDGRRQLWLVSTSEDEERPLTEMPCGVVDFSWSPDSNRLAVVSDVDPDCLGHERASRSTLVRVARRVRYRGDADGWRGDAFRHIFTLDLESGETRQLTTGEGEDASPVWSPDGNRIVFVSDRRSNRDFVDGTEAYVVSALGGELEEWSHGLTRIDVATWSPEGDRLVVVGSDDERAGWQGQLFILEQGRQPRRITDDSIKVAGTTSPVVPPAEILWSADDRILFLGDTRGESYLLEVSPDGGPIRRINGGGVQFTSPTFDAEGSSAAVLGITPSSPGDLQLVDLRKSSRSLITDYGDDYFRCHPHATMEKFSLWRSGMEIESRLFLPPDHDPGREYPFVLDIHGGPHGLFYDSFVPVQQILATAGYIVLAVNPRGSSSYGADYMKAVLGDWGGEDYLDIMAAVDEVCTRPDVDTSRLGVTGYSYGGFMTSWIIGHDTRFKAAVAGAPCINLSSMYGTSDIGVRFGEVQWGGDRENEEERFRERSPLTYVSNVSTPVLLLHGEDDVRCPIEQSEQYFVSLKRLGKEVEFVRFPGCSHGFLRTGAAPMRKEYFSRVLSWFDKYMRVSHVN